MLQAASRIVDFWLNRRGFDRDALESARAKVAGMAPAVVVTGGSRGIGFALARLFVERGHDVAIVARSPAGLDAAARHIREATGKCVIEIALDVTKSDASERIARDLRGAGCYPDILINNAAIGLSGPFCDHNPIELDRLVATNVAAVTHLMQALLPGMIARRRGGILNLASLGAYVPGPHQAAYYASKSYVQSLTEAVAAECTGLGVRVAVVLPGPVDTTFHADMGAQDALYRQILPAMTAVRVARIAYRGFMLGRRTIVPGVTNQFMFISLKLLPHVVTVPLTAILLRRLEK